MIKRSHLLRFRYLQIRRHGASFRALRFLLLLRHERRRSKWILGRKVAHISNYHLTFSAADGNDADVLAALQAGLNVATVFGLKKTEPMPETYNGRTVFNGDESDLRFLDPKGVIVGLYAKGKAKKDTTGFVKYPTIMMMAAA